MTFIGTHPAILHAEAIGYALEEEARAADAHYQTVLAAHEAQVASDAAFIPQVKEAYRARAFWPLGNIGNTEYFMMRRDIERGVSPVDTAAKIIILRARPDAPSNSTRMSECAMRQMAQYEAVRNAACVRRETMPIEQARAEVAAAIRADRESV